MADEIAEVKEKTEILDIIGKHVDLKKAGRNYKGLCPFHNERTPSFSVSPDIQIYKCFGCGVSGDVFEFMQTYEGMTFYEALKFLADKAGVKLTEKKGVGSDNNKYFEILSQIKDFYHYILLKHPSGKKALNYLTEKRGLNLNTIDKFKLGYSPDDTQVFSNYFTQKKHIDPRDLEHVGAVYFRNGRTIDRFYGRVMFPLFDQTGRVRGFAGRLIEERKDAGKYINTPETPLYHKSNLLYGFESTKEFIRKKRNAVIVEGELDMLSLYQAGIKTAVAIKGSAFTEEQISLLSRFADTLTLALDADIAGDKASRKGIALAIKEGLEVKVAKYDAKDPDEAVKKDLKGFISSLKNASTVWDFLVNSLFEKYDANTGSGKARISRELIPILESIDDDIVRSHYVSLSANRLRVPVESVNKMLSQQKSVASNEAILESKQSKGRRELLEEKLFHLAFRVDPKWLLKPEIDNTIKSSSLKTILNIFRDKFSNEIDDDMLAQIHKIIPENIKSEFESLIMDEHSEDGGEDKLKQELDVVWKELEKLTLKENVENLMRQIEKYQNEGNENEVNKLSEKFKNLTKKLSEFDE